MAADECVLSTPHSACSSHWPCVLLGNKKDCISSFRQVPTRDGEALADMLSVSGKGRRSRVRGRGGRWREVEEGVRGGSWRREVEEGGGGRGRTEAHSASSLGEVVCMRSIAHYSVL